VENRQSVIRKVTEYVTTAYGGDWQKAFTAYAVNGQLTRDGVIDVLKAADVGFLITRPAIAAQVMDLFDTNGDGSLSWAEFNAIAQVSPPAPPPLPPVPPK
jgi:Ca2+-binding EF-hand superfamily protein